MDIDTFSNRCTPASTDLSICIWLCVFSVVYNYFNVGGCINIRMNTYGIFFVRNIRKRVAASRRNIARYDFLFAFAEQMHHNFKIIPILNRQCARYVRMFGIELGWWFGYSLWSFDVLGGTQPSEGLSDVHFIRLTLKDKSGKIVSENNYWRGNDRLDFTALNTLPKAELKTSSKLIRKNGEAEIQAVITLPKSAKGVAFAVHVQAVRTSDGERILPALMNDNYFTLMPGETKNLSITFDENLLQGDKYKLVVTPYNNK